MSARRAFASIFLVITAGLWFGGAPLRAAEADDEAEHEGLRQLRAIVEEAINKNELDLLKPYLDENFSVVTYTDREFSDFEKFKTQWQATRKQLLAGGTYTTKLLPDRSQIIGDLAITHGNSDNHLVTGDGAAYQFPSHWTAVCRKSNGKWRLLRAQSSISPFDNPMLHAAFRSMLIKVGAACAVAGVALGWVVGALVRRRRGKSPTVAPS